MQDAQQQPLGAPQSTMAMPFPMPTMADGVGQPVPVRDDSPVRVRTVRVLSGRLICDVAIADPAYRYTTPKLAAFVARQFPDLPLHSCVNEVGSGFGSVIEATSVPHMLEHLAIDFQTRNASNSRATFVGTTEWTDERAGAARVEISFKDDLEALKAFSEALRFLNTAVLTCLS